MVTIQAPNIFNNLKDWIVPVDILKVKIPCVGYDKAAQSARPTHALEANNSLAVVFDPDR